MLCNSDGFTHKNGPTQAIQFTEPAQGKSVPRNHGVQWRKRRLLDVHHGRWWTQTPTGILLDRFSLASSIETVSLQIVVGGWAYPCEKWWSSDQLGWWNSQYMASHKIPWFQSTNQIAKNPQVHHGPFVNAYQYRSPTKSPQSAETHKR